MKVFLFAAIGAALLAGCAPFEHGHYANDVSYKNTVGDPPGTPLVYRGDSISGSTALASRNSSADTSWHRTAHHHGSAFAQPVQTAYAAPSYTAPVARQNYASAPAYTAQAYAAPQPVVQRYAAAPVVQQSYVQSAQTSTYAPASSYAATTFGSNLRFDSEGYAICDIPGAHGASGHAGHSSYY